MGAKKLWKLLFATAITSLLVTSCFNKEEIPLPEDTPNIGGHYEFSLSEDEADGVHSNITSIVCILRDSQGNIFRREADLKNTKKGDRIKFLIGLAEGKYTLLAIEFATDNPNDKDGIVRIGIGRLLEAYNNTITVKGAYNKKYNFGGSGTKEDPYLINCGEDLYRLQSYINSDGGEKLFIGSYFEQTMDIDLWDYSYYVNFEYGWRPIGESHTKPFQGHYDGKGHKITGMFINREKQSGVGIFGVLYNAVVQNLAVEDVQVKGDAAVGAIAGAVRGSGKAPSVSLIKNCSVSNSTLQGNFGTGGIVGLADVLTRVQIDSCTTASSNKISTTHYAAAGIIGGGVTNSSIAITNCNNYAAIKGGIANIGGIAGGADTLFVISCRNSGEITASATDNQVKAVGGIVGGSGIANIIDVHNTGNVTGYKGVGGILGSTIVTANEDGSNAVYNNAYIQSSHNGGKITGHMMVGGLCGEAQLAAFESYNEGKVTAAGDYAGGIIGTTSVSAIHTTTNFGDVDGCKNVGGIAGKVQEGSFAINTNFGNVTASENWTGGIFGKTGNQSIIHYCGNYGKIVLNGKGYIGGIAGEIGDPREWNGWDIAEVVLGAAEIIVSVSCCAAFANYAKIGGAAGKHGMHSTHLAHTISDAVLLAGNVITNAYTANLLNFPHSGSPSEEAAIMNRKITESCKSHFDDMEKKFDTSLNTVPFKAASVGLSEIPMTSLKTNRLGLLNFYRKDSTNHSFFNERINEVMAERYEEVEHNKHKEEVTHAIIQGVCMVASLVTIIVGSVVTGGAATAMLVAGSVVGIVSGANSISKGVRNYDANTLEISQCFNYGEISTQSGADAGCIAGRAADFSLISDNINGGPYNKEHVHSFVGETGGKVTLQNNICINGERLRHIADATFSEDYLYNNKIYCSKVDDADIGTYDYTSYRLESYRDILTKNTVNDRASYKNWDFEKMWYLPKDAAQGIFPVPYTSKMTYKAESSH